MTGNAVPTKYCFDPEPCSWAFQNISEVGLNRKTTRVLAGEVGWRRVGARPLNTGGGERFMRFILYGDSLYGTLLGLFQKTENCFAKRFSTVL
eukprot:SAG22_NODE_867_length_6776_cov_2.480455_3_plen_93_part_00